MDIKEIQEAVSKQPELKTALISSFKNDFEAATAAEGKIIRTKEEDQSFLDNHVKTVVDAKVATALQPAVDAEFGKTMNKIDGFVKDVTGVEKNPNEKTMDYAKRALTDKHKSSDPVTAAKVAELERLLGEQKTSFEKQLSDKDAALENREVEYEVALALDKSNVAIPGHIKTDAEKQAYTNQQKALIRQGFLGSVTRKKDNEGKIVFYEGEKPLMNNKDGKPKTASDIINEKFGAWFVPQGQQGTGTGTSPEARVGNFKSKDDIHKHLAAQGIAVESPNYLEQFEKLAGEAKISV